jgi:hypothetical protein
MGCFSSKIKQKPISESDSFPSDLREILEQYEKIQRSSKILLPPIIRTD